MIPMADENPVRRFPVVTLLLIVVCVVVYFAVQPTGTPDIDWTGVVERIDQDDLRFVVDNAAIPCELVQLRPLTEREYEATFRDDNRSACNVGGGGEHSPGKVVLLGVLVTMVLHGSVAHLFGNMLFLWVFGNNIESRRGWWRYLLLYLLGGVAATAAHVAIDPQSTVPVVGASGAIAAVMGAYLVLLAHGAHQDDHLRRTGAAAEGRGHLAAARVDRHAVPAGRGRLGDRLGRARRRVRVRRARRAVVEARRRARERGTP